jgi:deoxyxylulose-5-phosphate synthase
MKMPRVERGVLFWLANMTVVMTHTMVVLAMARLSRSKSAANRKDSKENEQAATNHLQRKPQTDKPLGLLCAMHEGQRAVNFRKVFPTRFFPARLL